MAGVSTGGRSGVAALLSVLDTEPQHEDETEVDGDVSARRIASEAASVQIMTVWAAKGLEFPVVCLPTLWRPPRENEPVVYLDPDSGRRTFDLSGGAEWPDEEGGLTRRRLAADEAAGERLRLLYVAMTRAQHQTVVWWAQAQRSGESALAHVLFARSGPTIDGEAFGAVKVTVPADQEAPCPLRSPGGGGPGHRGRGRGRRAAGPTEAVDATDGRPPGDPRWSVATLDRLPDRRRQRWSFSAIVDQASVGRLDPHDASMADQGAGDEREPAGSDDEVTGAGFAPSIRPGPTAHRPTRALR